MAKYLRERLRSFKFAFQGIATLLKETPNAKIHIVLAVIAFLSGFLLKISATEWLAIAIVIGLVFALEAVNSSIELLADVVHPGKDEKIKNIKDLAAAAVLVAAFAALIVGAIVFVPKIVALFK